MENNDSICYVARINEIRPIEGADKIEQIIVGGWNCIAQKNLYNVDDLVIVATTDAVIPEELAEELSVTSYLRKGNRVRTVKLRGVYSECLLIPYSLAFTFVHKEGDDLMYELGISKYEPPVKQIRLSSGKKIRYQDNPNFHVYYKFPNLKNVAGMFTEEDTVEITRKIHGTNARYGIVKKTKLVFWDKVKKFFGLADKWIDYEFVVGSHNVEKGSDSQGFYDTNVWFIIAKNYGIKEKLWEYVKSVAMEPEIGDGITIYGEIYGAGIQKNYEYGLTDIEFVAFDVKENGEYLSPINSKLLIKHILELPYVEILHFGNWSQEVQDQFVFNNFIAGTKIPEEGIVIKYHTGERSKVAKVINPDYLIYGEKHDIGDSH
ncbi:putative RNA ligase [uncultured Caudovirales phage]|uniref:Putative RNA ligase n=1 Tax=uncultured Caudovirales phage TaxID=2100421 RepID=A0A6J5SU68_9CAUD|nr:putative RNA ligase [uncultured Caudovirales phage]